MMETRESDRSTEPLLIKIRDDCDNTNDDVKKSLGGKWTDHGLVRNKRTCDETSLNVSFGALTNNKKRLVVFAALIVLLIYVNSSAVPWNDDRLSERVSVNHHSHVPGMKDVEPARQTSLQFSTDVSTPVPRNTSKDEPPDFIVVTTAKNNTSKSPLTSIFATTTITSQTKSSILENVTQRFTEHSSSESPKLSTRSVPTTKSIMIANTTLRTIRTSRTSIRTSIETSTRPSHGDIEAKYGNSSVFTTAVVPSTKSSTTGVFHKNVKEGFLVWTKECQIPDLDPFAPKIRMSFKKVKRPSCLTAPPLTSIIDNQLLGKPLLVFNRNLTKSYNYGSMKCCYSEIIRSGSGGSADSKISLATCQNFNQTIELNENLDSFLVTCKNGKKTVYSNVHVMIKRKKSVANRLEKWRKAEPNGTKAINVILFGIDSVSRMNLIRTMPKTAEYIRNSGWFEMAGYNKMGDNTFPNLMAVFTGYNSSSAYSVCKPNAVGGLDACPLLFYDYRNAGYVTAYAEDEEGLSTFNYLKKGFQNPPTDYYLRPTMQAAEKYLDVTKLFGIKFCLGYKTAAEYIYDYAVQVREAYKNDPYFGIFWTNSFSHNAYDAPSSMDEKILNYLLLFNTSGILNESIVIFFSDHGMRFGSLRNSPTGHLEERLPMLYIWLPPNVQKQYPEFVEALRINKNRLTTPYDLHMTLKHILELSGRVKKMPKAPDCPACQSLFEPIAESRSCEEVTIEDHWCTCRAFHNVDAKSKNILEVTNHTIDYINDLVKNASNGTVAHLCSRLVLKKLHFANKEVLPHEPANSTLEGYQLYFETNPGGAKFETTVRLDTKTKKLQITGTISRLNSYAKQAKCVEVEAVKKFCACKKQ